ncbi:MAG: hypothetical protein RQ729_11290 [Wenzhouxiangellaceae bacterium]|nr:hypothetical protein [Wenzhouxiangellaceae bacterium]
MTYLAFGDCGHGHTVDAFVRYSDSRFRIAANNHYLSVPRSYASVECCVAPKPRLREIKLLVAFLDQSGRAVGGGRFVSSLTDEAREFEALCDEFLAGFMH